MTAVTALAAAVACAGIVLGDRGGSHCTPLPPLVAPCRAVRACTATAACAITVTGRVTRADFIAGEAWGDWHQRLVDARGVVAAAVPRLAGPRLAAAPFTIFLAAGRSPLVADGLYVDDLGWLAGYRATGAHPDGVRPAPAGIAARLCPRYPSSRAQSRAK